MTGRPLVPRGPSATSIIFCLYLPKPYSSCAASMWIIQGISFYLSWLLNYYIIARTTQVWKYGNDAWSIRMYSIQFDFLVECSYHAHPAALKFSRKSSMSRGHECHQNISKPQNVRLIQGSLNYGRGYANISIFQEWLIDKKTQNNKQNWNSIANVWNITWTRMNLSFEAELSFDQTSPLRGGFRALHVMSSLDSMPQTFLDNWNLSRRSLFDIADLPFVFSGLVGKESPCFEA